jgi:integrase
MSGGPYGRGKAPERHCLPVDQWPAEDQRLWLDACRSGSILDEEIGARSTYAAITNAKDQKGYGRWLTWLHLEEHACLDEAPADRITPERVRRYVTALLSIGNGTATVLARLQELGDVAKVMGPGRAWMFINRLSSQVRARHRAVRDKLNLRPANELVDLGFDLMNTASTAAGLRAAIEYRDGLMIAFLALVPLRRRNLGDLCLDHSLVLGLGGWLVLFDEHETKTHAVFETRLPQVLEVPLTTYLEFYRPILAARQGRWRRELDGALWVSKDGSPMTQMAIYDRIRARTTATFGAPINPHLFRDAAATTMAVNDPVHVRISAPLLGHRTLSTTEKYYQQASGLQAQRSFIEVIESLKRGGDNG